MGHDATKVLLGTTLSSHKTVTEHDADPASFPAGVCVSLKSDGGLSIAAADGSRIGVSLGKSLSDTAKTAICRKGLKVPMKAMNAYAHGVVTITSYANLIDDTDDTLEVAGVVFTAQTGAATLGQATFRAATSNDATATSLAAQINAHATSAALVVASANGAVVSIKALAAGDAGEAITLVYDDVDGTGDSVGLTVTGSGTLIHGGTDFTVNKGAAVYIDSVTGLATDPDSATAVISNAVYAESGSFTGIDEAGDNAVVVLVDMTAGL